MGFFNALGRMIQGKPVFQPGAQQAGQATPQQQQPAGPKVLPEVVVARFECDEPGNEMELTLIIRNNSQGNVELEKIELLGRTQQPSLALRPGEERELRVYDGPRPTNTAASTCNMYYKDASGDYFYSIHHVEFRQMPDNSFTINRIHFLPPVRDM